jgi:hypothetical protein
MIEITLTLPHPINHVWNNLTNWEAHSAWIPNTHVTITHQTHGLGTQFVGITRLGPLTLNDPMTVTTYQPPLDGHAAATIIKTGKQITGTAGFTLTSLTPHSTQLVWFENVQPQPATLFTWATPIINRIGKIAFTRALNKFAQTL